MRLSHPVRIRICSKLLDRFFKKKKKKNHLNVTSKPLIDLNRFRVSFDNKQVTIS